MYQRFYNSLESLNSEITNFSRDTVIVYTYGAWDLVHPGHIKFIERAKGLGDFLIVGTVSDKPIKDLKGEDRPVQTVEDRISVISSLRAVDAAVLQPEYDPSDVLRALPRINILTKGDDWEYIPGQETIEEMGGKLVKLGYSEDYSTSSIVSKISGK